MNQIDIKVLTDKKNIEDWIPYRAHDYDAGGDLMSAEDAVIYCQTGKLIGTGVAVDIPEGYVGLVFSRSGMAKRYLRLGNCVGVIDHGYQGEIKVWLYNDGNEWTSEVINVGDRIAQLVIVPIITPHFRIVDEFKKESVRGDKGFGSTGL